MILPRSLIHRQGVPNPITVETTIIITKRPTTTAHKWTMSITWQIVEFVFARRKSPVMRIPSFASIAIDTITCSAWRRRQGPDIAAYAIWSVFSPIGKLKRFFLWDYWGRVRKNMNSQYIFQKKTYPWNTSCRSGQLDWRISPNTSSSSPIPPRSK